MSLYGAMFSGVSALAAQSAAMGAIADNISNVNTVGYKGTSVAFSTLVTKQTSTTNYAPGGTLSRPRQNVDVQGLLTATNASTDIAISGQGFFVVNEQADPASVGSGLFAYARAGSFRVDSSGYLRNTGGYYLQGWPLMRYDNNTSASASTVDIGGITYMRAYTQTDGSTHYINANIVSDTELKPLNLNTIGGTAVATSQVRLGANLPSEDDVGDQHTTSILLYDSLGNTHNMNMVWEKDAENAWNLMITPPSGASNLTLEYEDANGTVGNYYATGQLEFQGSFTTSSPDVRTELDGAVITIGGTNYEFDADAAVTAGNTAIDISAATSWADVINAIDTAVADARISADTTNNRVLITQSAAGAALTVSFTDNAGGALADYLATYGGGTFTVGALDATNNYFNNPAVTFNGDGTPAANGILVNRIEIGWANGAEDMVGADALDLFLGNPNLTDGMTQLAGAYQTNYISQDGAKFGNFAGVSIGEDGVVTALFDNGVRRPIFQIPVATFVNANGLENMTGNAWIETDSSGQYNLRVAGESGAGTVQAAALEASTVDMATEFSTMITTQRAYSAAAKVITTSEQMLDDLLAIKR